MDLVLRTTYCVTVIGCSKATNTEILVYYLSHDTKQQVLLTPLHAIDKHKHSNFFSHLYRLMMI